MSHDNHLFFLKHEKNVQGMTHGSSDKSYLIHYPPHLPSPIVMELVYSGKPRKKKKRYENRFIDHF